MCAAIAPERRASSAHTVRWAKLPWLAFTVKTRSPRRLCAHERERQLVALGLDGALEG
jgi:hypothetical protein